MSENNVYRRDFLKTSGGALAGSAVVAGGAGGLLATQTAFAMTTQVLSEHEAQTLLSMCRTVYPHPALADSYYAPLVSSLDQEAADNADTATLLKEGVASLDAAKDMHWRDLSDDDKLAVLNDMEGGAFFLKIKGKTVVDLYNDPKVWQHLGYEGEAFSKGGYIQRGFDDLNWLPDPPEEASPKGWWE